MIFSQNGASYKGEWKNGVMHGFGTYLWKDGKTYIGYMV